ncbi:MAG: GxxExxY protein [Candidatus Pollutiaquabacter aromativorans]|jgi:GxxExxY protein
MLYPEITDEIIRSFYNVYKILGYGFLEKVYENSMIIDLLRRKRYVEKQVPIDVHFDGHRVGKYFADLLVDRRVIVEIKAVEYLIPEHELQLINYLKATDIEVGLLLNFGPKPQFTRKVFSNSRKRSA